MKKRVKRQIAVTWIVTFLLLCSITVQAAYQTLGVNLVRQAKSLWGWAACIEMSASYLGYTEHDQWDIVNHVKGTIFDKYPNKDGGSSDYKAGMEYATDNSYTLTFSSGTISIGSLADYIENHLPVHISLGTYDSSGKRQSGHGEVIYAVDEINQQVKVRNPGQDAEDTFAYSVLTDTTQTTYWDYTGIISQK